MEKFKFSIIGCGRIAERHARHINEQGILESVCDIDEERAKKLATQYSCKYYLNIDELLKNASETEIISICTPNGLHCEHTIKSLRANKHVVCEKPMALTVSECEKMISEAANSNKRLFIVKQNRFNQPVADLKKIIDKNVLGRIINVQLNCFWNRDNVYYEESDWKGTLRMDGGILFTQFSHFIDLLIWLIGDITETDVIRNNYLHRSVIEFEDTGVVLLKFENGAIGTINYTINSFAKNMEGSITVFGDSGTVKIGGQYLNILEYQNIRNYVMNTTPVTDKANEYGFYQGSMSNHDRVYQNVINVLQGKERIATNAIDGMKVVRIIENIYKNSTVG